jgi:hypothetical protein
MSDRSQQGTTSLIALLFSKKSKCSKSSFWWKDSYIDDKIYNDRLALSTPRQTNSKNTQILIFYEGAIIIGELMETVN